MKVGINVPQFGINSTKENLLKFIQSAEQAEFESLWVYDRLLCPVNPRQPYPGTPDQKSWPVNFENVLDPITTLSFVAANTTKTLLGTCVIDMLYHSPVGLAKEFATIDVLSSGRLICGLGIGWSEDEYIASGIPFERRGKRGNEFLEAMKSVWTQNTVEFDGEFYKIPKSKIGPKPIQKPNPKILPGGFSKQTFDRMIKYGDGYVGVVFGSFDFFEKLVKTFDESIANSTRKREDFDLTVIAYPQVIESSENREVMTGTIDEIGSDLSHLKDLGVDRVIIASDAGEGYDVDKTISLAKDLRKFC